MCDSPIPLARDFQPRLQLLRRPVQHRFLLRQLLLPGSHGRFSSQQILLALHNGEVALGRSRLGRAGAGRSLEWSVRHGMARSDASARRIFANALHDLAPSPSWGPKKMTGVVHPALLYRSVPRKQCLTKIFF